MTWCRTLRGQSGSIPSFRLLTARAGALVSQRDYDGAIKALDRAITINADDADAYYIRGLARHARRDYDGVLQVYD